MSVIDHGRRLAAFVRERGFDLVLATHMFPLQAMVIARRRGWTEVPVVGFNPDTFDTHVLFAVRGSDAMCAPTEEAARRLRRLGVPAAEVRVTGYPIDAASCNRRRRRPRRAPRSAAAGTADGAAQPWRRGRRPRAPRTGWRPWSRPTSRRRSWS
jgi:hypothetical protein